MCELATFLKIGWKDLGMQQVNHSAYESADNPCTEIVENK
jgi:hypothetical protein